MGLEPGKDLGQASSEPEDGSDGERFDLGDGSGPIGARCDAAAHGEAYDWFVSWSYGGEIW